MNNAICEGKNLPIVDYITEEKSEGKEGGQGRAHREDAKENNTEVKENGDLSISLIFLSSSYAFSKHATVFSRSMM